MKSITSLFFIGFLLLALASLSAQAKPALVLLKIQGAGLSGSERDVMRQALQEGLATRYKVFSGSVVDNKLKKYTKKTCDATKCLQEIAIAFQGELIGRGVALKKSGGYLLTVEVKNIFEDQVIFSKGLSCRQCDIFDVRDQFRLLGAGGSVKKATAGTETIVATRETGRLKTALEKIKRLEQQKSTRINQEKKEIEIAEALRKIAELEKEHTENVKRKKARILAEKRKKYNVPEMVSIPGENYAIGKYEVTQGQWQAIMGSNPSRFKTCGKNCPVEIVSWNDVKKYIKKLNSQTGETYHLPTETEWEKACLAGRNTEYCGSDKISEVAWYDDNSGGKTHSVGQKSANEWGLYDMSGNVREWVEDCYETDCTNRVLRGGSWSNLARAVDRGWILPTGRDGGLGFRLARTLF